MLFSRRDFSALGVAFVASICASASYAFVPPGSGTGILLATGGVSWSIGVPTGVTCTSGIGNLTKSGTYVENPPTSVAAEVYSPGGTSHINGDIINTLKNTTGSPMNFFVSVNVVAAGHAGGTDSIGSSSEITIRDANAGGQCGGGTGLVSYNNSGIDLFTVSNLGAGEEYELGGSFQCDAYGY